MAKKTIPRTDAAFNEWQQLITIKSSMNVERWGLDAEWMTNTLEPAKANWQPRWAACQNPATRTQMSTFEKTEARKVYEPLLRILVGNLEYNTRVTDQERVEMGIAVHPVHRTTVPVPTTYPDFTVDTSTIRRLVINFRNHNTVSRAKPAGVSGAVIRWAQLDEAPEDVNALINSELDTASPFTLEFAEEQRGKKAYICLAWQNTKGEKGPWCEIGAAIIP